jgi:predicted nucleotidyltransferase
MDRSSSDPSRVMDSVARAAQATPGLELLLLFGSRARGDDQPGSDWDFGYLATDALDVAAWLSTLVELVGSDRVDLVDLRRAGGLLRYRAARDGRLVYEAHPRLAERFSLEAAQFWCDASPVLQRGYDDVLAALKP